jgi:iron complex outermembrane receptor protein
VGKTSKTSAQSSGLSLRKNPLALACAAAFLLAGNAAYAQSTPPTTTTTTADAEAAADANLTPEEREAKQRAAQVKKLESVKVVGIRLGIENAIETKQQATSIVESVSAEDIGKLPDSSIAESIARLPGLTAQRERGRATQIQIRGFAGDFAGTTLNGREQVTMAENRGVEFDQYPSELLSQVVVYKTPDASLVGQGLSGPVDMRTVRPLEFDDRVATVSFRGDQNENNGDKVFGNRYSFAYIDQFSDDRFGIAIGYAHLDSPNPGFQNESWGYPSIGPNGGPPAVSGGGKVYHFDGNNERDGWMGTIQFRPNDFYEGTVDVFYSTYTKTEVKSGIEFGTQWGQGVLQPGYTTAGSTIVSSDWTNVLPVVRMDSNPINDELGSFGFNNKFHFSDDWEAELDYSYSFANRKQRFLETYAQLAANNGATTLGYDLDPSGQFYNMTFGADFNDPSQLVLHDTWGQSGYLKDFGFRDKLHSFRASATRHFDSEVFAGLEFGVNYADREKTKSSDEARLCIATCQPNDRAPFPGSPTSFGIGGIEGLATFDANDLFQSGFYHVVPNVDNRDIANKNFSIHEKLTTFYAQLDIDAEIGGMPLRGNVGFQYVDVDQKSTGLATYAGNQAGTLREAGAKYNDFLPSLNLSLGLPWESFVRFAAARQMARPRMDDMRANFDVSISNTQGCGGLTGVRWCGSGGNPELQPFLANAYDISLEKYFTTEAGHKGYASAAYFYKDLTTFIVRADFPYDFAGSPLPPPTSGQVPGISYPATTLGSINAPFNGTGGWVKGTELTVSVPLDIIWHGLDGFGFQGSYSDTDSHLPPVIPGSSDKLLGLSKYVSNMTAYYERAGFSVRYSRRTRSSFRGETRGGATPGADLQVIDIQPEVVRDAQINYSFQPGSTLEGLSLYLQMSNLGDQPFRTADTADTANRPIQYFEYGKTTLLGFSYKF